MEGIVLELKDNKAVVLTPNGEFLSVPSKPDWNVGKSISFVKEENQPSYNKHSLERSKLWKKRNFLIGLVASILILLLPLSIPSQASVLVTLDINPSLELEVKNEKVIAIHPLNEDGKQLLLQIPKAELRGELYHVTSIILDEAKRLGYLKEQETNILMVGILDKKENFEASKFEQIIEQKLMEYQLTAEIIILNTTDKNKKDVADNKGISLGKQLLQSEEKQKGYEISDKQLKETSIKEILSSIKSNNNKHGSLHEERDKQIENNTEEKMKDKVKDEITDIKDKIESKIEEKTKRIDNIHVDFKQKKEIKVKEKTKKDSESKSNNTIDSKKETTKHNEIKIEIPLPDVPFQDNPMKKPITFPGIGNR